ncbi:Protein MLP1 homolog {ECO:0000303/PubMed:21784248} [Serendipita indica DSM 11827]|nr:Protein MLP1 homolog {ECO:0000303/PubMed:21784248} [Serendipita indica DSM 11827]
MAPQTRHAQAQEQQSSPHIQLQLPEDVSTSSLDALLGPNDWSAPSPDTILAVYRLLISQKEQFDAAFQDWEERLAQKDADIEQTLHQQETFRVEYTEQLESLKGELDSVKKENAELAQSRAAIQDQLATLASTSTTSTHETEQLRIRIEEREREKKTLTDTLDAALNRETRLHSENTELRSEVQNVKKLVADLQAKLAETSSSEATQHFKISTLEQQINLLQESNDSLNNELSNQLSRYTELRRARTEEVTTLQSKLDQKTSDYDREAERLRAIQSTNHEMERKLNEALEKNRDLQSEEAANKRAFQEEMQACKDLLEKYERIADDAKTRIAEIEREEEIIRRELTKREETLLAQADRERERADSAERKVEELEEVLQRAQAGEFSMAETSFNRAMTPGSPAPGGVSSLMLSPTASIVSKLQRGGRSITEVYADYVRLQKELQQEKQEKQRLETTLNDIFNEIQDRAPVLTQQRLEYERVSAEARQLATQLSEVMEDRDQQARAAREAQHALASKQKEVNLLNKQQVDLSRQVRGLMHQLARALDPTLPEEFVEDVSGEPDELLDGDGFVTSNLVLFRSIPHLQQQNQTLLSLTRSLASQLEERDRKAAADEENEMMAEARAVIESLQTQLQTSQAKMEAYIKERDVFKAMASRRQGSGASEAGNVMVIDGGVDYHQKYDEEHAALDALKRETARDFEELRKELKKAQAESTDAHVALGKARATNEYHLERYRLLQSTTTAQTEELKTLSARNNELQAHVRQAEIKIGELSSTLAEYSSTLAKAQSESQLLRNEKALQKSREERLEQENRQLHAERTRNNQTLEDYRRMKDELSLLWEENKQSLEQEKTRLMSEVATLRDEIMTDRAAARSRLNEKEAEIRDLSHRLSQLTEESTKSREAAAVAQANQSHLQARADDLNKQLQRALEKLAVFERRPGTIGIVPAMTSGSEEENLRAQLAELSAELKTVQLELTNEKANAVMYQELAQTTEQALEDLRRSTDEYSAKTQQDLATKEAQLLSLQEKVTLLDLERATLADQKKALESEMEVKATQFAEEKKFLEDIVADVRGADERAVRAQEDIHQELRAEAQRTHEAQTKYQALLVDHSKALEECTNLRQQLQDLQVSAERHAAEARSAQHILTSSQKSWEVQSESLKQEVTEIRSRYDDLMKQNTLLHNQLASVTSQAARLGELSETAVAAIQAPSNDSQVQELQQVIKHVQRDADLLRGQCELLKRENARINGDVRRLTSELESTRQRLSEEREMASKAALNPNDQQTLLSKVSENAALIESNRVLREEKAQLEQRLQKKSDDLIARETEISPLKQEVITLRSELEYVKVENEKLQESIDQWRKRATSIMTKFERIDPEVHEQVKAEAERLEAEVATLKAQLSKSNDQVAKWKDAQQQWKNAAQNAQSTAEQAKERQSALIAERDSATSQLELVTKSLEAARAELEEQTKSNASKPVVSDSEAQALRTEVAQLKEQNTLLQTELASLKEQVAKGAPSGTGATGEQVAKAARDFADLQARARKMAGDLSKQRETITNLEKEKAALASSASTSTDVEAIVAQRVAAATAQLQSEKDAAVAAAIAPLQQQLNNLASAQPNIAQLQQQAAEIRSLQEQLAKRPEGLPQNPELETIIQTRVAEQVASIQEEHNKALAQATENGRREADAKLKMLNMQFNRVKTELAQLKGTAASKPVAAPGGSAPATTNAAPPSAAVPSPVKVEPAASPLATLPAVPVAAGLPASPVAARGRGRGAANPRGAPATRARGAAPAGTGRGTVLDAVNQAIAGGAPASPSGQLSILGASGQKRARDEDDSNDPGALAKRLKPGEGGLPARPAGRGGAPPARNRLPGSPAPGP